MSAAARRQLWFALGAGLALLAAGALPARGAAQPRDIDIERFEPALDAEGFLAVQGTRTPGHLRTSFGWFTNYETALLSVERAPGDDAELVSHRLNTRLSVELGLFSRAAVALTLPLVLYQTGDKLVPSAADLPERALRDPGLHARYRLLGDADEERNDGPGLALQVGGTAPLGTDNAFASEDAARAYAELLFDMHLLGAGAGASIGIRHRFDERALLDHELHDEMTFGAAIKLPVPPLHPLVGLVEVRGATDFKSAETTAVEGELAALFGFGELTLALSVGAGFTGGVGVPDVRAIAGLWFTPRVADSDGDGISDEEDGCPPLPEDRDGHQDRDGCPDPDNDNDLVPDVDDLCPDVEALEGQDDDEDGCTDR